MCTHVRVSMCVVHTCYCASSMRVEIREQLWESGVESRILHSKHRLCHRVTPYSLC